MIERFVIFGASGDLTARLLLPALSHLVEAGLAPDDLSVTGVGVGESTTTEFQSHISEALASHAGEVSPAARSAVVEALTYEQGDVYLRARTSAAWWRRMGSGCSPIWPCPRGSSSRRSTHSRMRRLRPEASSPWRSRSAPAWSPRGRSTS